MASPRPPVVWTIPSDPSVAVPGRSPTLAVLLAVAGLAEARDGLFLLLLLACLPAVVACCCLLPRLSTTADRSFFFTSAAMGRGPVGSGSSGLRCTTYELSS